MKDLDISVVIPVYNAENYIANAVESALAQPEVAEIILIEDNSPDNALAVCQKLEKKYEKVRLYQHPNGENRGAGASRNLGIKKARFPFIAFLDADDWYLENRFEKTKEVFRKHPKADGVYDAVGVHFQNKEAKEKWFRYRDFTLTVPDKKIDPNDLLEAFLLDATGHFCTDGIVIKKSIFDEVGLFDTELEISQDTHMWIKMAANTKLYPGDIENPRAIRRIHDGNRWTTTQEKRSRFQKMYWKKLDTWAHKEKLPLRKQAVIRCAYLIYKSGITKELITPKSVLVYLKNFFISLLKEPVLTVVVIPAMLRRIKTEIKKIL
jgi:glycosyltransferase involved in cell wall biosynthesis